MTKEELQSFGEDIEAMRALAQEAWSKGYVFMWLVISSALLGWRLRYAIEARR